MFVIMADVNIQDITLEYSQIGSIDESYNNSFAINDKLSLIIVNKKDVTQFDIEPVEFFKGLLISSLSIILPNQLMGLLCLKNCCSLDSI